MRPSRSAGRRAGRGSSVTTTFPVGNCLRDGANAYRGELAGTQPHRPTLCGYPYCAGAASSESGFLLLGNETPSTDSCLQSDDRTAPFQPLPDLLATAAGSEAFALKPAFSPTANAELWNPDMSRLVEHKPFRRAFRACCDRKRRSRL